MSRTFVMYIEIGCFISCVCGWILICSTLPTEYWNFSEVGDAVLTTVNYFSNLWMDCVSDTTGVSDCKMYPSMLALPVFLHVCRALAVVSVILGFWGAVFTLIGMKCTKIGGSEILNARITFAAALAYIASGLSGMTVYSLWGHKVRTEFVDLNFKPQRFELGAAVFVGWGGSSLIMTAGAVLCYVSGREGFCSRLSNIHHQSEVYTRALSRGTYLTGRNKESYTTPVYSRSVPVLMPPLFNLDRGIEGGKEDRGSKEPKRTQRTYRMNNSRTIPSVLINMDSYV